MPLENLQLPETTRRRLVDLQRRVRLVKSTEAVLIGVFGLTLSYLMVFSVDRFADTSWILRAILLVSGTIGILVLLPVKLHRWVWGTRRLEQVALLLGKRFPALADQLLGVLELTHQRSPGQPPSGSRSLAQAAIRQVDELVRDRDLTCAVPVPRHREWTIRTSVPVLLTALTFVIVPAAGRNALCRWLRPWSSLPRYSFTQLEPLPGELVVPRGEAFPFAAELKTGSPWKPQQAVLSVSGQTELVAGLQGQRFSFLVPPRTTDCTLQMVAGDYFSSIPVHVAERPELTALSAVVHLPPYLQRSVTLSADARSGKLSLVRGSSAELSAQISRALSEAWWHDRTLSVDGNQIFFPPVTPAESEVLEFQWRDELKLSALSPFRLQLDITDDAEPHIVMHQVQPTTVVLSTDVVAFELQADDDFGLRHIGLEWRAVDDTGKVSPVAAGFRLTAAGGPEITSLNTEAVFCAESDKVQPQMLELRAFAEDFLATRGRVYSAPLRLHVMSPEEHAVWMATRMRRWASLADDVYDEEMRLHAANRELRQLSAAEITQPETRLRIEQQAEAENANAELLGSVTDQGEQLIEQALMNREMRADHLESFAQSLQRLRDISSRRMPAVADLLNKSATAPGGTSASSGKSADSPSASLPLTGNHRGTPGSPTAPESTGSEKAEPTTADSSKKSPPAVPQVTDVESGAASRHSEDQQPEDAKKSKASPGRLSLPVTMLQGGPQRSQGNKSEDPSAQQQMDAAVEEQSELLTEFNAVRDELQAISDDLENSTFVKRLKAASRRQLEIAEELGRTLYAGFGVESRSLSESQLQQAAGIALREDGQRQRVLEIQADLTAWSERQPDEKLQRVLQEMQNTRVVAELEETSARIRTNLSGEAISRSEFWSDTLDRWAEELVLPPQNGKSQKGDGKGGSLPPAIVLEVMRILHGEMNLREATRSAEQARSLESTTEFAAKAKACERTQTELFQRTRAVLTDIRALPEGDSRFSKEIASVELAGMAMLDATFVLSQPDTGPKAIAAQTEAIELLLQSRRNSPKPSAGGKSGTSPGSGSSGNTDRAALEQFGPSSDRSGRTAQRDVMQATGTNEPLLPEEFRDGLDVFYQAIESRTSGDRKQ